jgi:cytochrome b subunit of formate dehydrogenase
MNKLKINYLVDFIAFISFLVTSVTGLIIFIFLPSGVRQGRLQEFIGITKEVWNFIHIWSGILMLVLVIIHLILHWDWIVFTTKKVFGNNKK